MGKEMRGLPTKPNSSFRESDIIPEFSEIVPDSFEELEKQIKALDSREYGCKWLIGKRLLKIDADFIEQSPYNSIFEYANDKLGIARRTTYQYMEIAENFSFMHTRAHGSKLRLLMLVKDVNKRKELLNFLDAKEDENNKITYRELEKIVKNSINLSLEDSTADKETIYYSNKLIKIDIEKMGIKVDLNKIKELTSKMEKLLIEYSIK